MLLDTELCCVVVYDLCVDPMITIYTGTSLNAMLLYTTFSV